ncbi:MAG: type II secretion system protein [Planctomycetota bacterium]|jgi:prepilin-type N-terminal cleavage/methylation domain-containing protein
MKKNAFTIIEVLIALILVGIAIASLLAASNSFTKASGAGAELSTAEFLTEQIRELTTLLPVTDPNTGTATFGPEAGETLATYNDLDDFDSLSFSPPISTDRQSLTDFVGFSQQITVENVSSTDFGQVVADHGSPFVRITTKVFLNTREICAASWIRAKY